MARKRPQERLTVKASIVVDARTHALWSACASLSGVDRSAFAVEAIRVACQGLILVDKRKPRDQVKISDRLGEADHVKPDGPDDAA